MRGVAQKLPVPMVGRSVSCGAARNRKHCLRPPPARSGAAMRQQRCPTLGRVLDVEEGGGPSRLPLRLWDDVWQDCLARVLLCRRRRSQPQCKSEKCRKDQPSSFCSVRDGWLLRSNVGWRLVDGEPWSGSMAYPGPCESTCHLGVSRTNASPRRFNVRCCQDNTGLRFAAIMGSFMSWRCFLGHAHQQFDDQTQLRPQSCRSSTD